MRRNYRCCTPGCAPGPPQQPPRAQKLRVGVQLGPGVPHGICARPPLRLLLLLKMQEGISRLHCAGMIEAHAAPVRWQRQRELLQDSAARFGSHQQVLKGLAGMCVVNVTSCLHSSNRPTCSFLKQADDTRCLGLLIHSGPVMVQHATWVCALPQFWTAGSLATVATCASSVHPDMSRAL